MAPLAASKVSSKASPKVLDKNKPCGEELSTVTFTVKNDLKAAEQNVSDSSSYTLAQESLLSSNVDRWIRGTTSVTSTGVQNSRVTLVQRSTLAMVPSFQPASLWYVLAMVLPLFSSHNTWRCNTRTVCNTLSAVLNTAELMLEQLTATCSKVRNHVRRIIQEQIARDIFATIMDLVLIVYAGGFLILSMYQASVIGTG